MIPAYNLAVSNDKLLSSCFDTTGLIPLNPFVFNNKDFAGLESQVSVITTMAEASGITDQLKLQQLQAALPVIGLTQKIRATADSNAQPAAAAAAVAAAPTLLQVNENAVLKALKTAACDTDFISPASQLFQQHVLPLLDFKPAVPFEIIVATLLFNASQVLQKNQYAEQLLPKALAILANYHGPTFKPILAYPTDSRSATASVKAPGTVTIDGVTAISITAEQHCCKSMKTRC